MNVASKELCQELYELSGWHTDDNYDWYHGLIEPFAGKGTGYNFQCPAYALGYLLRKLPLWTDVVKKPLGDKTIYGFAVYNPKEFYFWSDTPEDAACKLAIELFKSGVLSRD